MNIIVFLALLLTGANAQNITLSGCEECEIFGNCSTAYKGEPGQFCHVWMPKANLILPCCCPVDSECIQSRTHCECRKNKQKIDTTFVIIMIVLIVIFIAICIMICITNPNSSSNSGYIGSNYSSSSVYIFDSGCSYGGGDTFSGDW